MKLLYDNPDELIEVDSIQESTQEIANITQENLNSTQEITNDTQEIKSNRERLISLLHGNPNLTLAEIAEIIGLTRDGVKKIADKLLAEGILSHEGSTKAGKWIVKLED
ncbi:MAG: winged helix-turn-helix transcriptional regulator [Muribaculaceae bacterium]|nr:winged helix-turn-helix transcriptional regulator [Muribaculaceae bacterium]